MRTHLAVVGQGGRIARSAGAEPGKRGRRAKPNLLPVRKEGVPFSLLGYLRMCSGFMLTPDDAAFLLQINRSSVYDLMNQGVIPPFDTGSKTRRIDPAAWALAIELRNPHLKVSAQAYQAA